MNRVFSSTIVAILGLSTLAQAQLPAVTIGVSGNQLVTVLDADPNRVFPGDIGENGFVNSTDDPALVSTQLQPDEQIGLVVLAGAKFWDVSPGFWRYPIDSDEMIDVRNDGSTLATFTGVTGRRDLGVIAAADDAGVLNHRLEFHIRRPCGCLVAFGVYAFRMQLTSNLHEPSEPFLVLFRYFIDDGTVADAMAAAGPLLDAPVCGGDFDLDGQVGISDLTQMLSHFGLIAAMPLEGDLDGDADVDLSDLTSFLANFGSVCN